MKNIIRTLLLLLTSFWLLPGFGQVVDAAMCDSTNRLPITRYTWLLRTTEPVPLDSALATPAGFARSGNQPVLVFEYDPYHYWFKVVVRNREAVSKPLMLLMAPVGLYNGRLFQKKSGQWQQVAHAGLKYRFEDRSYQFTHHVFPFTLAPNSTDTLYISIDANNVYKSFGFALIQPKALKVFENSIYFVFGIIIGLLLLFFLLNIALYFVIKDRLHLWYALYIALLFLVVMKNDHLDQQFLGFDTEQAFRLTPYMTFGALAITVLMHVIQRFFVVALKQQRLLYRLSTLCKLNVLGSAVVHYFVFLWATDYRLHAFVFGWAKISVLLGICVLLADCVYCIRKGWKSAWFPIIGSLLFLAGAVQRLFFPSTLSFLFPPTTFHLGIISETIIISLALIYRYWSDKEQIETQTLKDISEEIHDDIGPDLFAAKNYVYLAGLKVGTDALSNAEKLVDSAGVKIRNLSRKIKGEEKSPEEFRKEIERECAFRNTLNGFVINLEMVGEMPKLNYVQQTNIIRIIKELLQNAIKHSGGSEVNIAVECSSRLLSIVIRDNGMGFDMAKVKLNGLEHIRHRCRLLKTEPKIESRIGQGTSIFIRIPIERNLLRSLRSRLSATVRFKKIIRGGALQD